MARSGAWRRIKRQAKGIEGPRYKVVLASPKIRLSASGRFKAIEALEALSRGEVPSQAELMTLGQLSEAFLAQNPRGHAARWRASAQYQTTPIRRLTRFFTDDHYPAGRKKVYPSWPSPGASAFLAWAISDEYRSGTAGCCDTDHGRDCRRQRCEETQSGFHRRADRRRNSTRAAFALATFDQPRRRPANPRRDRCDLAAVPRRSRYPTEETV